MRLDGDGDGDGDGDSDDAGDGAWQINDDDVKKMMLMMMTSCGLLPALPGCSSSWGRALTSKVTPSPPAPPADSLCCCSICFVLVAALIAS